MAKGINFRNIADRDRLGISWLSGLMIPHVNRIFELSYIARCIEILRSQLSILGGSSLIFISLVVHQNWPNFDIFSGIWIAISSLVSLPLLFNWSPWARRLSFHPVGSARIICLISILLGLLWGSSTSVFPVPLGSAALLAIALIGFVILAPMPLAQLAFLVGFALGDVFNRVHAFSTLPLLAALVACIVGVWISAHVRFFRTRTASTLNNNRLAQLLQDPSNLAWKTDVDGMLTQSSRPLFEAIDQTARENSGNCIWLLGETQGGAGSDGEDAVGPDVLKHCHRTQASFCDLILSIRVTDSLTHRFSFSGHPRYDTYGSFVGFEGVAFDLTHTSKKHEKLLAAAERDALTKLMNRATFNERLQQLMAEPVDGNCTTSVMLIDLDKFKQANDTLGHQAGDQILRQFSERLKNFINRDGFVARLGGDEFGVILPEITTRGRIEDLADKLIPYLSSPYDIGGVTAKIGATIGIAIAPEHGDTVDALVRNADLALYSAKARGRNQHRFFDPSLLEHALERRRLEIDLRSAIENGELSVLFQPIVDCKTDRLCGFEALARWVHPVRGEVSADEFIALAETTGMIDGLGERVLRDACAAAANWPSNITLAVNLSPAQFRSPGLTSVVVNTLAQSSLAPSRLELEITEGVFLAETECTNTILKQLHSVGVRWTLDDFGTGYSSLKYLMKAPFTKIKIDREFVNGLSVPGSAKRPIVGTIVALASNLNMLTTAEGVESHGDLKVAKELGCTQIQGFVYGPKLTAAEAGSLAKSSLPMTAQGYEATRREKRAVVLRSADIVYDGEVRSGTVRNVSAGGAMLETDWTPAVGIRMEIEMDHEKPRVGVVRWVDGKRFGIQFEDAKADETVEIQLERRRQVRSQAA